MQVQYSLYAELYAILGNDNALLAKAVLEMSLRMPLRNLLATKLARIAKKITCTEGK